MANGPYSSVMIIAADGLVQNQGIAINGNLTVAINSYTSLNTVASFGNVLTNASAAGNLITSSTLSSLQVLGGNIFPALTNTFSPSLVGNLTAIYGNSIANVYGNTVTSFTSIVEAQSNRLLGNTGDGPDLGKFAQVYGMSQGYRNTTNQILRTVNNSQSLAVTFTNMDSLTTGGISQVSNNLVAFGSDLVRLGNAVNLELVAYLGHPWALLQQIIARAGLIPGVATALANAGISNDEISQIRSAELGVAAALDQKIYRALLQITGVELEEVRILLNITTFGLTSAADLLNPQKMLPNSYKTLLAQIPTGNPPTTTTASTLVPWYQYSSFWSKASTLTNLDRNWGLYRSWYGSNPDTTWGSNTTTTSLSGTVTLTASGNAVDVVIVDGVIDPYHPEFAVRSDGQGGSRVKYFNWYSLNIPGDPMYGNVYNPPITTNAVSSADDSRHACHVAGTVAGNTQGWAPSANIYNISPQYVTGGVQYAYLYKYILYWHNQKRAAGNMTPTIVNNSWYSRYTIPYGTITFVTYQGSTVAGPFTINQLAAYGINVNSDNNAIVALRNAAMDADIQACINAGIIMVACAGNDDTRMTTNPSDIDYNNTVTAPGYNSGNPIYYSRGSSPGSASNVICVGSISSSTAAPGADRKLSSSNCGPRVDLFAPGAFITSAWLTDTITPSATYPTPVPDPRNGAYYIAKYSGTSMASPQVCGILACALEVSPTLNQTAAVTYITQAAGKNQIPTTTGGVTDPYDLQGAPNRYLALPSNLQPPASTASSAVTVPIYTASGAVNSQVSNFLRTNPYYIELSIIIPPEQAAAATAWSRSLGQVKNITDITLPTFAVAVSATETNVGLGQINALTTPIPPAVKQNTITTLGTGTGPNGTLTIYDFMGSLAGAPYIVELPLITANIASLSSASLIPLTDSANGIYAYMNNTLAGAYNDPDPATTVTIPSGPAAGTYGNIDQAFDTGLIPAAISIIGNVANANPTQVVNTNNSEAVMFSQIDIEDQNLLLAQVNFNELQANSKPAIMSLATNLHEIGQDVTYKGSAQFFAAVADTSTLTGQAVVASLREGRNIKAFSDAGIGTDSQISDSEQAVVASVREGRGTVIR